MDKVETIVNLTNPHDSIVTTQWLRVQTYQKPFVSFRGLASDTRSSQFWGALADAGARAIGEEPITIADVDYLFGVPSAASANALRQWAELAYWFPSLSGAVGAGDAASGVPLPANVRTFNLQKASAISDKKWHSAMHEQPYLTMIDEWKILTSALRGLP